MGCDIHGVVQRRWPDGKGWETLHEIDRSRNYTLFAVLAGVRNYNDIKPIAEPHGLPEDFQLDDDEHVFDHNDRRLWMGDHSHSWLYLEDIEGWSGWTDELRAHCDAFLTWLSWIRKSCVYGDEKRSIRIVFGFDN